ncbi:MAG: sodium/solute symporter, partial [Opitutaceae bacterium]|nr:sodium/solute symporter [Opitutaceae bacterium]
FILFLLAVIAVGLVKSRTPSGAAATSESYFLAGRGLKWWLIGVSLIAANISSEQFVGMSGNAADFGMAVASYEWMAAITLVVVAFCFLPYFLRTGIFTIPHFLEHRYNGAARAIMAVFTMIVLIGVSLTGVIYAGALTMSELFAGHQVFGVELGLAAWSCIIGAIAALYVCAGGLKASAWADLIQGIALIVAGAIISWLAIKAIGAAPVSALTVPEGVTPHPMADGDGGLAKLAALNYPKLTMFLPASDKNIPWTALLLGLWIPNFYYWGLNQYITQRVLGSASLREGQKGIVFAAGMKLIIPFVIVIPGIIAFNLYSKDLAVAQERSNDRVIERVTRDAASSTTVFEADAGWALAHPDKAARLEAHNTAVLAKAGGDAAKLNREKIAGGYKFDAALNLLIKKLLPAGLVGFVLAAMLGAIVSSLAAVLNAASTIFTMDIFQKHVSPDAAQAVLVRTGRVAVLVFAVIGCVLAPLLDKFGSIFKYIQEFQGYISPGILAVFVFGLINRRAPGAAGVAGLLLSPVLYGLLAWLTDIAFLNRMAICLFAIMGVMWVMGLVKPLAKPVEFATHENSVALESSKGAKIFGWVIIALTLVLYVIFSPLGLAK